MTGAVSDCWSRIDETAGGCYQKTCTDPFSSSPSARPCVGATTDTTGNLWVGGDF